MVMSPKNALRRLKLEELIAKLEQIEEQLALTLHEYPHGHTIERQRLALALTKQIRAHLNDQLRSGKRVAILHENPDPTHLRVVDSQQGDTAAS